MAKFILGVLGFDDECLFHISNKAVFQKYLGRISFLGTSYNFTKLRTFRMSFALTVLSGLSVRLLYAYYYKAHGKTLLVAIYEVIDKKVSSSLKNYFKTPIKENPAVLIRRIAIIFGIILAIYTLFKNPYSRAFLKIFDIVVETRSSSTMVYFLNLIIRGSMFGSVLVLPLYLVSSDTLIYRNYKIALGLLGPCLMYRAIFCPPEFWPMPIFNDPSTMPEYARPYRSTSTDELKALRHQQAQDFKNRYRLVIPQDTPSFIYSYSPLDIKEMKVLKINPLPEQILQVIAEMPVDEVKVLLDDMDKLPETSEPESETVIELF